MTNGQLVPLFQINQPEMFWHIATSIGDHFLKRVFILYNFECTFNNFDNKVESNSGDVAMTSR